MKRAQRAALVQQRLQQLYPHVPRSFLRHSNPYTLLIAVLLSARCTDKKVNEVTPRLFARAADPHSMSQLPISTIQKLIRPCGLSPQKAKAISQLSQLLLKNHGGQVPQDFPSLEALPGVGHKTASVVLAVAWNIPTFPVDTHIHRLAQRWGLTRPRSVTQTEKDLKKLFPQKNWNRLHAQIILYGREHCSAHACDGTRCPLCRTLYPQRTRAPKIHKA